MPQAAKKNNDLFRRRLGRGVIYKGDRSFKKKYNTGHWPFVFHTICIYWDKGGVKMFSIIKKIIWEANQKQI